MNVADPSPSATRHRPVRRVPGGDGLRTIATGAIIVAALYFGREIFVPFALAILLSFVLAPIALLLRRWHLGRIPSVLLTVVLAFVVIAGLGAVIASQVGTLAENLPKYQSTIRGKIQELRGAAGSKSVVERASAMLKDLGDEISKAPETEARPTEGKTSGTPPPPVPVEIKQPDPAPLQIIQSILGPLLEPLATTGIVIVFVIFILLQREDLRDRIIRLAGAHDLQRTTQALDDAARRVSRYLLMQTIVNATYGVPVGVGLFFIGVPNPVLWGILAMLLRFVPYVGPVIAALFPMTLSIAVDDGWSMVLWTAGLFITLELISNNVVEPWLYGASTGLSELAIIAAATFWTWLWGPIGLLLSTPLTSCLVVLGRHVPQLQFLDVLLGNEPVLAPEESFYQRMLAGDPHEAAEQAEEILKEQSLVDYYDEVALRGLALAQRDLELGSLSENRSGSIKGTVEALVDDLADHEDELPKSAEKEGAEPPLPRLSRDELSEAWRTGSVLCAAAQSDLDEAAAVMLAQVLGRHGLAARISPPDALSPSRLPLLDTANIKVVILSYLDTAATTHARYLVRRLRRALPGASIVVGFWTITDEAVARNDPLAATGADGLARSMRHAVKLVAEIARSQAAPPQAAVHSFVPLSRRDVPNSAPHEACRSGSSPSSAAWPGLCNDGALPIASPKTNGPGRRGA